MTAAMMTPLGALEAARNQGCCCLTQYVRTLGLKVQGATDRRDVQRVAQTGVVAEVRPQAAE